MCFKFKLQTTLAHHIPRVRSPSTTLLPLTSLQARPGFNSNPFSSSSVYPSACHKGIARSGCLLGARCESVGEENCNHHRPEGRGHADGNVACGFLVLAPATLVLITITAVVLTPMSPPGPAAEISHTAIGRCAYAVGKEAPVVLTADGCCYGKQLRLLGR